MGLLKARVIRIFLFSTAIAGLLTQMFLFIPNVWAQVVEISAKDDYVACWKQPCIYVPASEWSEKNPNGVGIAVAMGTKSIATDDQIKEVLLRDFTHYQMKQVKFFFEKNDTPATSIAFHVRGGSEGPYLLLDAKKELKKIAKRAANTTPLLGPS